MSGSCLVLSYITTDACWSSFRPEVRLGLRWQYVFLENKLWKPNPPNLHHSTQHLVGFTWFERMKSLSFISFLQRCKAKGLWNVAGRAMGSYVDVPAGLHAPSLNKVVTLSFEFLPLPPVQTDPVGLQEVQFFDWGSLPRVLVASLQVHTWSKQVLHAFFCGSQHVC